MMTAVIDVVFNLSYAAACRALHSVAYCW